MTLASATALASGPLQLEDTVPAESVGHRLALGVQWLDALSGLPTDAGWVSELDAIGARPCPQRFDQHPQARHALRNARRLARVLAAAAADKLAAPPADSSVDPTNVVLCAYGCAAPRPGGYATGNDPRRAVPRRLALTPVQSGGVPTTGIGNVRSAWLWPGSNYPLAGSVTALRGRVRRGAPAMPVAWARVVVTRVVDGNPPPAPDFATETRLACGHGDDRGEFLVVLGPAAVTEGVELPVALKLNVWVFLPPMSPAFDPAEPLASLPLEVAGSDALNDVLRGIAIPPGYVMKPAVGVTLALGAVRTLDEAQLLF